MTIREYFSFIVDEIHSTVIATVDDNDLPVTCAIDIMDFDENGLYFLTAKGKGFYDRLKKQGFIALTGMRGKDTLLHFEFFDDFVFFSLPVTYSLFAPAPSTQYPFFNRAISTSCLATMRRSRSTSLNDLLV